MTRPDIVCRQVAIAYDPSRARGWYSARRDTEELFNALSFTFPEGERFFIQAVRTYEDRIADPKLREDVRRFVMQEGMHAKEYARCNRALSPSISHGKLVERLTGGILAFARYFPRSFQLALTCALEHMTAILADSLLSTQQGFVENAPDQGYAKLWLWHAAEEIEHKAVAFDVYEYVFGKGFYSYLRRVFAMALVSGIFAGLVTVGIVAAMFQRRGRKSAPGHRSTVGLFARVMSVHLYWDFYRRHFHPWDHDNSALVAMWKTNDALGLPSLAAHPGMAAVATG